jgi:hypothetical protein
MSDSRPRDLTPEELSSTQSPATPQGTVPTLSPHEETGHTPPSPITTEETQEPQQTQDPRDA